MFDLIAQQQTLTEATPLGTSELLSLIINVFVGLVAAFFVIRWMLRIGNSPKYNPQEISSQLAKPINKNTDDSAIADILTERTRLANNTLIQFLPMPLIFFLIIFFTKEFITHFAVVIYNVINSGATAVQTAPANEPSIIIFSYFTHVALSLMVGFGGIFAVKKFTGFPAFRAFFMGRDRKLRDILEMLVILALSILWIYFVISMIWTLLLNGLGFELEEQLQIQSLRTRGSTLLWVATTLAVVVGAPIIEEILFRGFLYQFLRKHQSVMFAAISQGFIFAIMHLSLSAFLPLWLFGIILALFVEKYKSLLPAIIAHAIFNGITIVMLFVELN